MSAQNSYNYSTSIGAAGGIVDLAPYAIDTFLNEENNDVLKFGVGVVSGTNGGEQVKLPASTSTAASFEGIVVNSRTAEYDIEGNLSLKNGAAVGVMRYGRVYGRVAENVTPAYGEAVLLIISGDEAGYFTNTSGNNTVAIKARFLGGVTGGNMIAPIELFNQAQEVPVSTGL